MNLRPWVAASLAVAALALPPPPAAFAAEASARHVSGSPWLQEGGGGGGGHDHHHHSPWRHCHSRRRVVLIDKNFRVILKNGRRGPEAIVLQMDPPSTSSSPGAPWKNFHVEKFLDVKFPVQTTRQYVWEIRDFFRVHPRFVVKSFDRHKRNFSFPAAICEGDEDGWSHPELRGH